LDFGPLLVNTICYRHLTIANDSLCDLQFKLLVQQFISGPYGDDDLLNEDEDIGIPRSPRDISR